MLRTRDQSGCHRGGRVEPRLRVALSVLQSFELFVDDWTPRLGETTAVTLRVPYGPRIVQGSAPGR